MGSVDATWPSVALAALGVVQTVALAYIAGRWRRTNGHLAAIHESVDRLESKADTVAEAVKNGTD
jgi:hypothetical protein